MYRSFNYASVFLFPSDKQGKETKPLVTIQVLKGRRNGINTTKMTPGLQSEIECYKEYTKNSAMVRTLWSRYLLLLIISALIVLFVCLWLIECAFYFFTGERLDVGFEHE